MKKSLWFFHIVVSLAIGLFGLQKVFMSIPDLIAQGMWWIEDFTPWQVRTIGVLEALGVLGLNLPYLVKSLPRVLVPLSAAGLAVTMVGTIATHIVRGDPAPSVVITTVLLAMSSTLAIKRLGQLRTNR